MPVNNNANDESIVKSSNNFDEKNIKEIQDEEDIKEKNKNKENNDNNVYDNQNKNINIELLETQKFINKNIKEDKKQLQFLKEFKEILNQVDQNIYNSSIKK